MSVVLEQSNRCEWVSFSSVQRAVTFLELKPLTQEHLSAVLELDQLCFGGLWTLEGYQRELNSPNSEFLSLFIPPTTEALTGETPAPHISPSSYAQCPMPSAPLLVGIGCLWAILEEAHITILAVHPHYQHQGLGRTLLIALLTAARGRSLERATLEVRASNLAALSLYQSFGFKTAGRRRRYYQDTGEDALILWRGDLQHPGFHETLVTWQSCIGDRLTTAGWNLQADWDSLTLKTSLTRE